MQNTVTPAVTQRRLLILLSAIFAASSLVWGQSPARPQFPEWQRLIQKAFEAQGNGRVQDSLRIAGEAWTALRSGELAPGELAPAAQQIAGFYQNQGYDLKAEAVYKTALEAVGDQNEVRFQLLHNLSFLYQSEQRNLKAIATLREALKVGKAAYGENSRALSGVMYALAMQLEQAGNLDQAEEAYRKMGSFTEVQKSVSSSSSGRFLTGARVTGGIAGSIPGGFAGSFISIAPPYGDVNTALAGFYQRQGRMQEAEQIYRDALSKTDPGPSQQVFSEYANFLISEKRFAEAAEIQTRAIRVQETSDPHFERNGVPMRLSLANTYVQGGQFEKADEIFQQSISSAKDSDMRFQVLIQYASALEQRSKFTEAESIFRKIADGASSSGSSSWEGSFALNRLAMLRERQGDKAAAAELHKQASIKNPGAGQEDLEGLQEAQRAMAEKRWNDAEQLIEQASSRAATQQGENACYQSMNVSNTAQQLWYQAHRQSAEAFAKRTISICEGVFGPDSPRGINFGRDGLFSIYLAQQRWKEAEALWTRAMDVMITAKGDDSPALIQPLQQLVNLHNSAQKLPQARETLARILAIQEGSFGPNHPILVHTVEQSGDAALHADDWPTAEQFWKRALAISESSQGRNNPAYIHTLSRIATKYFDAQHRDEGAAMIEQALELAKQSRQADNLVPMIEQQKKAMLARLDQQNQPASAPNSRWFNPAASRGASPQLSPTIRLDPVPK